MKIRGSGIAASIRDLIRANIRTAPPRPSKRPAPISNPHGRCFYRSAPRLIFRHTRCGTLASGFDRSAQSNGLDEPIRLSGGSKLVTLEDAGDYITKLPKADHTAAEWQAAMEALILVATLGGPTMFARIGVMRALNRGHVREFDISRKDHHWGKRKLARER